MVIDTSIDLRVRYEAVLRTIGAYLDAQGAHYVSIVEVKNGLTVRYVPRSSDTELRSIFLSYADILETQREREEARRHLPMGFGEHAGRYENLLRAMGHDLQQAGAYNVVVDEVDDGFVVTHCVYNPIEGYLLRKRMDVLSDQQCEALLTRARQRRQAPATHRLFHLGRR
jgi:hypothetical protein